MRSLFLLLAFVVTGCVVVVRSPPPPRRVVLRPRRVVVQVAPPTAVVVAPPSPEVIVAPPPLSAPTTMPLEQATATCVVKRDADLCDVTSEAQRLRCRDECSKRIDWIRAELLDRSVASCVATYSTPSSVAPVCTFTTLSTNEKVWLLPDERQQCSTRCAPLAIAARKKAAVRTAAARAAAAAAAPKETEATGLRCNDGTMSPSCSCEGSHRGCCSHHGGVAGCG